MAPGAAFIASERLPKLPPQRTTLPPRPMGGRWARGGHQSGFRSAEMLEKKPLDCALGRFTKTPFLDIHIVTIVIVIVIKWILGPWVKLLTGRSY